jgi:hypothetical protein
MNCRTFAFSQTGKKAAAGVAPAAASRDPRETKPLPQEKTAGERPDEDCGADPI